MVRAKRCAALHKRVYDLLAEAARRVLALSNVLVLFPSADVGRVGFHEFAFTPERAKLASRHRLANAVCQKPRALVGNVQGTMKLMGADALLAGGHEVDSLEHL